MPSAIAVEVRPALASAPVAPFVYAYYDGIDKIAHDKGLGEHYRAELRAADPVASSRTFATLLPAKRARSASAPTTVKSMCSSAADRPR